MTEIDRTRVLLRVARNQLDAADREDRPLTTWERTLASAAILAASLIEMDRELDRIGEAMPDAMRCRP